MTPQDADYLLRQWGAWAGDELRELRAKSSSWQKLCESGYQESSPHEEIAPGSDHLMMSVESAVTRLRQSDPANGQVIKGFYKDHRKYSHEQHNHAIRRFIGVFYCPL